MSYNAKFAVAKYMEKFDCYQTSGLRLCYQHLIKPQPPTKDNPTGAHKYSLTALLHVDANMDVIFDAAEELAKQKFGKSWENVTFPWRSINEKKDTAAKMRDALTEEGTLKEYTHFIAIRSEDKPDIVHPSNREFDPSDAADELYAGRWLRATCRLYAYDKGVNKGISLALRNVQLLDQGDRLKLGRSVAKASEEFEAASDEEEDMPEERSARRRPAEPEAETSRPRRSLRDL